MCQEQLNDMYEKHKTTLNLMDGYTGKLHRYNNSDWKFWGKLPVHETIRTPVTSTYLSVDYLELKIDRMSNKHLHIESAAIIELKKKDFSI
jgi:hypothetical protein